MPVALEPVPATVPLVVVAHDDPATADSLRHAVETAAGWRVAVAQPDPGGLAVALAADPAVALVGCAVLADLPAGCRTPLLAIGDDDRPADLRAALQAGAVGMLAWPDGAADLPGDLARAVGAGQSHQPAGGGLVVAARGVHGGAGTTTLASHLAAAWARWGPAPVLLADLAGGLGFRLDLGDVPSWSALAPAAGAASAGTALDGAGLAAAVAEPWTQLAVLPLPGPADGTAEPPPEPWVVQEVLDAAWSAYRLVVCDLPTADGPAVQAALAQADALLAVGRCETAGIRGIHAALAAWAAAGRDPAAAGGVVTGVRPKAPLAPREVRAVLGDQLWGLIPAAATELAAAAEDGALLLDRHDLPAIQAMLTLANRVVPFAAVSA
jgi:Flp pilus assembly CpaE family ATPase